MKIDSQRIGTVDVITPLGALADEDGGLFIESVKTRLEAPNPRLVLSLQEVPYFDSQTIETLVDAASDLEQRGGRLRLASVTQTCREVLELTGQAERFEFFDSVQDAVRSFL
jgi:anti-anti-sigma factor